MAITIGIDFGTSFCSASWHNLNTDRPEAVRFKDNSSEKLPSVIAFNKSDKPMVGQGPLEQLEEIASDMTLDTDEREMMLCNFFTNIKTNMRQGQKWRRPTKIYTDDQLIALILEKIRKEVTISCPINGEIENVVLTHPVQFEEWKKDMLKHAAALAGFKKVKLLEEPIAAAMYVIKAGVVPSSCKGLLVYDFGAGTFDVTYIQVEADGELHLPIPPQGDAHCGGNDIDMALYNDWNKYVKATKGNPISSSEDEIDIAFKYRCCRQKEQLSRGTLADEISAYIPNVGKVKRPFTQEDFNRIAEPIVDRTIAKTKVVLDEVKKKGLPLTHAVLIGGSSNLPMVQTKMKQLLGNRVTLVTTGSNDIAVAVGAMYSVTTKINKPKPKDAQPPTSSQPKEEPCYCIYCGRKIMTSHKVCMYCGKPNFSFKQ